MIPATSQPGPDPTRTEVTKALKDQGAGGHRWSPQSIETRRSLRCPQCGEHPMG